MKNLKKNVCNNYYLPETITFFSLLSNFQIIFLYYLFNDYRNNFHIDYRSVIVKRYNNKIGLIQSHFSIAIIYYCFKIQSPNTIVSTSDIRISDPLMISGPTRSCDYTFQLFKIIYRPCLYPTQVKLAATLSNLYTTLSPQTTFIYRLQFI